MDIILTIIFFAISLGLFVLAFLHFKEKGFLFNNAYIYATKQERETMNKKPHYRQSAIVFTLLGIIFLLNALDMIFRKDWLFVIIIFVLIITLLYSVISEVKKPK